TWYVNNPPGGGPYSAVFAYDGFTQKMTILLTGLSCGSTYNLHFAVADAIDENYDAALFIGANSVQSNFAVGEIAVVDASPFCVGDEFTASITHNPSWNYTWSTGESGLGVSSVVRTAVFGVDEISVVVADGDGCLAERSAEAIVHTDDNVAPFLLNTQFTYYVDPDETLCFGIYSSDFINEDVKMSFSSLSPFLNEEDHFFLDGMIPAVNHEYGSICWTPTELNYGENNFAINLLDNNACGALTNSYTFTIVVTCPLCPQCIYYENKTPEIDPLPELTVAAKCIEAGFSEPVVVGDDPVEFRAGEYIALGEFFAEGPFFAQITGETCIDECTNCCEDFEGFRWDEPHIQFSPDGDGVNDIWTLNDEMHSYCAFNAKGFKLQVVNRWGRTIYEHAITENFCCPFQAANDETGLDYTEIFWDGRDDDGDWVSDGTYFIKVTLYGCDSEIDFEVTVTVGGLDLYLMNDGGGETTSDEIPRSIPQLIEMDEPLVEIYPSPVNEILYIRTTAMINENAIIYVYDTNGKLCLSKILESEKDQLDVSVLAAGLYTVVIVDNGFFKPLKFIKA
ncbi:MAG: gliding motility-associated C-terminal domain-containing protein, partial [Crocinitomix sp.]|nr:gliding motility-associated C-terminal domain-containing protein [Crocinitomix sp.]